MAGNRARIASEATFMHGVLGSGIITSVDVVTSLRIAQRRGQLLDTWALHILAITHTRSITLSLYTQMSLHTLWHWSAVGADGRRALWTPMHWRHSVRRGPGRATADGRRRPAPRAPPPRRPSLRCVRHTPRLAPHPTSNPLFTDGRPVSGAFAVPAASRRSLKFNALPMSGL